MFLYLSLEVVSTFVLYLHYWPSLSSQDGYILAKFFIALLLTETKSRLYHQPLVGKWARAPLPNRRPGPSLLGEAPEKAVEIGPRQSQPSWPNNIGQKENLNLETNAGNPEYLARSGSQSEWRIRFILLARGFSHIRSVLIDLVTCLLMFVHYLTGLTAFDFISDFEEWIECSYFNEEIKARLKGKPSIHERLSLEKPVTKLSLHLCLTFLLLQWVIIELFTWEQQTEKDKEEFGESPFPKLAWNANMASVSLV